MAGFQGGQQAGTDGRPAGGGPCGGRALGWPVSEGATARLRRPCPFCPAGQRRVGRPDGAVGCPAGCHLCPQTHPSGGTERLSRAQVTQLTGDLPLAPGERSHHREGSTHTLSVRHVQAPGSTLHSRDPWLQVIVTVTRYPLARRRKPSGHGCRSWQPGPAVRAQPASWDPRSLPLGPAQVRPPPTTTPVARGHRQARQGLALGSLGASATSGPSRQARMN